MRQNPDSIFLATVHAQRGAQRTPLGIADIARRVRADSESELDAGETAALQAVWARAEGGAYLPAYGVDAEDLAQTGWGVIVPEAVCENGGSEVLEALAPLLGERRQAATRTHARYRVLGYRAGENGRMFLERHGVGPGVVDTDRMPYYLTIVGSPEDIPFTFQHQLGLPYAVGRLDLETRDDYETYARAVLACEHASPQPLSAAFVGVMNDAATRASADYLAKPLAEAVRARAAHMPPGSVTCHVGEQATREALLGLLRRAPSLLFIAAHGLACDAGDLRQRALQGALDCQDTGDSGARRLAGEDISSHADLSGSIAFLMACFSAGTPEHDQFRAYTHMAGSADKPLCERPFVARLPQRMLARGALAVIGHVDRAWDRSFVFNDAAGVGHVYRQTYESTVCALLDGKRVGSAMEYFSQLYACLAAELAEWRMALENPLEPPRVDHEWAYRQLCAWDARNYVILGDPAARLSTTRRSTLPSLSSCG